MKNKYVFSISIFLVLYFIASTCRGITYIVPIQYSTIQAALNACNNYDTVLVDPGVYTDTIVWPNKKGLKLLSTGNENNTIIDVQFQSFFVGPDNCICVHSGFNKYSVIIVTGVKSRLNGRILNRDVISNSTTN